ncbi:hypothetical protein CEXT_72232 [Caerostris extrusa]|uniref:Uncharacterized protein n=1 Tax=Caerostris extrusa TaxID=172846 RepID=A0AAV4VC24_CAEEX|nr:hypothetical protein CEXT_72232 [Caerostris extrusa]
MNLIPSSPQSSADVKDDTVLSHETEENLMSSVKKVASTVTDGTPPRMSKFAQRFGRLSAKGKLSDLPEKPINAMLKGMIVQKQIQQRKSKGFLKEHQQNCLLQGKRSKINIFDSPPFDVFKLEETTTDFKKKLCGNHYKKRS